MTFMIANFVLPFQSEIVVTTVVSVHLDDLDLDLNLDLGLE